MRTVIGASCRLYRVMLYAYPYRLRAEFGEDMLSTFEQQLLDARCSGGCLEVCRIWAQALWETAHLVTFPARASCGIAVMSLLSSSALFLLFFWVTGLARHCVK